MAFRITARTLLHLGGELISSDSIALYELIKNAFDAGSRKGVHIEVVVRLSNWPGTLRNALSDLCAKDSARGNQEFLSLRAEVEEAIELSAPGAVELRRAVVSAKDAKELRSLAEGANTIVVRDTGHGMSRADLDGVFLTIGTRHRLEEKQNTHDVKGRPILGEKGLGRLSVMRLGSKVTIETTREGEANWSLLEIDWSLFSHDSDAMLDAIDIAPRKGPPKSNSKLQGTTITVSSLNNAWAKKDLITFASEQVSKLTNPFTPESRYPIILRFNGEIVPIPEFDRLILNNAHAHVRVNFEVWKRPQGFSACMSGQINYVQKQRQKTFSQPLEHLVSISDATPDELASLGPFSAEIYWFNRQYLRSRVDGGVEISKVVNEWSGGLMLFRDGFRVLPYGEKNNDWLDLDSRALAFQAYKVNRKQLIGKVEINTRDNPALRDQTNREGLQENPEKRALVALLKYVLESELRYFLKAVDDEERAQLAVSFDVLETRARKETLSLKANLRLLKARHPEIRKETTILSDIDSAVNGLEDTLKAAQLMAQEFERGRSQVIHLAGLGLMIEFLTHELNRTTQHALSTIEEGRKEPGGVSAIKLRALELELKTLQKRLSTYDPATTSGRQRRENFDLVELAQQILDGHEGEFARHHIAHPAVVSIPAKKPAMVYMVKGMVVQVLENLISNAAYWLKQKRRINRKFEGTITISVNKITNELRISDNGPGVPENLAEAIFTPFYTTKPPGDGKGLGLYISREVAHYHDLKLFLSPENGPAPGCLNTFVLTLPTN